MGLILAAMMKAPAHILKKNHEAISLDRFILTKAIPVGINLTFLALSYGMVLSFAAMYGKERGVSHTGIFFTVMALGMVVSRTFSGRLIDRGFLRLVCILGIVMLCLGFSLFTFAITPLLYFIAAFLIGMGYGITFPAFQTLFINLGTHHQRGTANSTYFTAFDLGVGLGMITAGKIAEMANLSVAFGVSAVACILSLIVFIKIIWTSYQKHKLV
jgi:MFS family permease